MSQLPKNTVQEMFAFKKLQDRNSPHPERSSRSPDSSISFEVN
jgi:hypothetical protein